MWKIIIIITILKCQISNITLKQQNISTRCIRRKVRWSRCTCIIINDNAYRQTKVCKRCTKNSTLKK